MRDATTWALTQPCQEFHPDGAKTPSGHQHESHPSILAHESIGTIHDDEQPPTPDFSTVPAIPAQANLVGENSIPSASIEGADPAPLRCDSTIWYNLCNDRKVFWPHKCVEEDGRKYYKRSAVLHCLGENLGEKCTAVFKYPKAFNRHYSTVHIREANRPKLDCPSEGCHRVGEFGFTRKDNLVDHRRKVHGEHIPKNPVRFDGCDYYGKPIVRVMGVE